MLLAAGSVAGQTVFAAATSMAKSNKGRIGVQLYSVKDEFPKDFDGTLKKLSAIGYSYVEAYGFTEDDFFGHTMKELSKKVKDLGMSVSGSHIWKNATIKDPDSKEWDFWKTCAATMKSGGAEWAILSSIPKPTTLDDLKNTVDYFNHAGKICKEGGVRFGFHNHYDEFTKIESVGEAILDYLIKNTDPKLVSFQLDLGHVINGGGDIMHYVRDFPGRIRLWHASDFRLAKRTYTEDGTGNVPYPELFKLADSSGLERLVVEQETTGDIFASLKTDFDYLKQFKWTKV
jgi:sugar phosphate isomerase/epimerase